MKHLKYLILLLLIFSCKEKTFADDIVLFNDFDIKMKFQEFNEDSFENSSPLIYRGELKDSIALKYFLLYPKPPEIYNLKTAKQKEDSIAHEKYQSRFFNGDFPDFISSNDDIKFDSLTKDNLQIIVKNRDTIPHFVIDSTKNIKAYKAYPVFIKNISGKDLKMVIDQFPGIVILNEENKWQIIKNDSFYVCGNSKFKPGYWVLKPDEIIVYAVNHFKGKQKAKFKIGLTPTYLSEEFEGNIDPKIIRKQRDKWIIK
jgi:hypothetical protein